MHYYDLIFTGAQDANSSVTMVPVLGRFGPAMAIKTVLIILMKQNNFANPKFVVLHNLNVVMEHAYQR